MKKAEVLGRAIKDLGGLQESLKAAGFMVLYCDSAAGVSHSTDGAGPLSKKQGPKQPDSGPYTCIVLDDAETKDPSALVLAFADSQRTRAPKELVLESPNGTLWNVTVDDAGKVSAKKA